MLKGITQSLLFILTPSSVTVNNMGVSSDGQYFAYTVDTSGEELYNLYIKNLQSGQVEVVKRNVYSFAFGIGVHATDVYYTVANNLMRTNRMYEHPFKFICLSIYTIEVIY